MHKPDFEAQRAQDARAQTQLIHSFLKTIEHFFGGIQQLFANVHDPRDATHVVYPQPLMAFVGMLMFCCHLGARRQIAEQLRDNAASAEKFLELFGVPQCPHGDTLNAWCKHVKVAEVQAVVSGTVATLIRQRVWEQHRLLGHYYLITIDGTGLFVFQQRHCPHCLTRSVQGQTQYYHPVLEAKLVSPTGIVCSVLTEFIENPEANVSKQDCELKAFERLVVRLKERFPRLPLCLSLDAIYAGGPTFALCERYAWKYMIVMTEADLATVNREFAALLPLAPENRLSVRSGQRREIHQEFSWVNQIHYVDSAQRSHRLSVLECWETKPLPSEQRMQRTHFKWLTNIKVTTKRVQSLAAHGGRLRWKTENEGFNVQKNQGYALEHAYSKDWHAAQVFYLLLQLAHLVMQLWERGSLLRRVFPNGVGSAKHLAFRLVEAWRNARLRFAELQQLLRQRMQIRFDSS